MKIYVRPPTGLSRAMTRVGDALALYAPSASRIVEFEDEADVVVLHVIGFEGLHDKLDQLAERGQKYVVMQYCLRTTERPLTRNWLPVWQNALSVWSYYDLRALAYEDHDDQFLWESSKINFYYAPLGVDSKVFRPCGLNGRQNLIVTSGYVAHTEGVAEVSVAASLVGGDQFHLGPEMYLGPHVHCKLGITDSELAKEYSSSLFVAGLRRKEGFELPAAEGLLCGARPIMFDAPHYRAWFEEFAEFIPEASFDETVDALHNIFLKGAAPVTRQERELAAERFNWEKLVNEFWQTV